MSEDRDRAEVARVKFREKLREALRKAARKGRWGSQPIKGVETPLTISPLLVGFAIRAQAPHSGEMLEAVVFVQDLIEIHAEFLSAVERCAIAVRVGRAMDWAPGIFCKDGPWDELVLELRKARGMS